MNIIPAAITAEAAQLVADIMGGRLTNYADIARRLVGLGLDLVPVEQLRIYLDEADRARAEHLANLAQMAKFGASQ